MAKQLRELLALEEDVSLVPRAYPGCSQPPATPAPEDPI